jgi:branched-chain amino acid transport system permease protein
VSLSGPLIAVQVMSGLSVGMFLFLVSVGMSLIFGVTRIVNLAHGSLYMVGAYLMVTLVEWLPEHALSFWVALLVALLGVAVIGGVIEMALL